MATFRFLAPILLCAASPALAAQAPGQQPRPLPAAFHAGPVIPGFGKVAKVDSDMPLPAGTDWKVAFDVVAAEKGKTSRGIESAARFVNMMVEAGVPRDKVHAAVVVHGPAVFDVVSDARYAKRHDGAVNPNAAMVRALVDAGIQVWVCGQSAAAQEVEKADLLPGVKMALSAITAHAVLERQGYTVNPF